MATPIGPRDQSERSPSLGTQTTKSEFHTNTIPHSAQRLCCLLSTLRAGDCNNGASSALLARLSLSLDDVAEKKMETTIVYSGY